MRLFQASLGSPSDPLPPKGLSQIRHPSPPMWRILHEMVLSRET